MTNSNNPITIRGEGSVTGLPGNQTYYPIPPLVDIRLTNATIGIDDINKLPEEYGYILEMFQNLHPFLPHIQQDVVHLLINTLIEGDNQFIVEDYEEDYETTYEKDGEDNSQKVLQELTSYNYDTDTSIVLRSIIGNNSSVSLLKVAHGVKKIMKKEIKGRRNPQSADNLITPHLNPFILDILIYGEESPTPEELTELFRVKCTDYYFNQDDKTL